MSGFWPPKYQKTDIPYNTEAPSTSPGAPPCSLSALSVLPRYASLLPFPIENGNPQS